MTAIDDAATDLAESGTVRLYRSKSARYFEGCSRTVVELLPMNSSARVLEIGCGAGLTGALALADGRAAEYVGVELNSGAAEIAAGHLTRVLVADIERADLTKVGSDFDALIMSEVLEHLVDPWATMRKLVQILKIGSIVICSSPNVANRHTIIDLLHGKFDYAQQGVMDRAHLRWFTPTSLAELVESAGCRVESIGPLIPLRAKARLMNALSGGRFRHLFHNQTLVVGRRAS